MSENQKTMILVVSGDKFSMGVIKECNFQANHFT